ncbi:nonstructural protein [Microviridae sp.]|nr:nonstructural protein [Microviridae sp.]
MKFLYTIYDQAAQTWLTPFTSDTDSAAQREFLTIISDVTVMRNSPSDFDLYVIGTFSQITGTISSKETVQKIVNGLSLVQAHNARLQNENAQVSDDSSILPSAEGTNTTQ